MSLKPAFVFLTTGPVNKAPLVVPRLGAALHVTRPNPVIDLSKNLDDFVSSVEVMSYR